jgi:hypothetical protein
MHKTQRFWRLPEIEDAYRQEHPEWPEQMVKIAAKRIHMELNRMDVAWWESNERFRTNCVMRGLNPDGEAPWQEND